jgi:hypothetical protein
MAVGNGVMRVTENEAGNLAPGDLLVSSSIPGHAMKDPGTFSVAHVIARVAEPVDWSHIPAPAEEGTAKTALVSVLFESFDRTASGPTLTPDTGLGQLSYDVTGPADLSTPPELIVTSALRSLGGTWEIAEDGTFTAKKVSADEVASKAYTVTVDDSTQTTGEGVIPVGETEVIVRNTLVTPTSRIMISYLGNTQGARWIEAREDGLFHVRLKNPAPTDIRFEYWIIGVGGM